MNAGTVAPLRYDPFDPAVIADPYPVYRRLRDEDPVHRLADHDGWAVTRFEHVWGCFARPDVFSNAAGITGSQLLERRIGAFAALGNLDDPVHRVRRSAVKQHFTPAGAEALRARCAAECRDALAPLRDGAEIDIAVDYGLRVSVAVVAELLGIPRSDRRAVAEWVRRIFYRRPEEHGLSDVGVDAYAELSRYCVDLATEQRRSGRGADVVGAYLDIVGASGRGLADEDLGSHLREVLIGGAETNPKALAAAVFRLAEHPDQRAAVTARPELARPAFEEAVRLDTPGQFIGRTVAVDVELGGRSLRAGDVALLMIASANRDDREFAAPDSFDLFRRERRSVGFGHGVHFCLGRHVAALEGEVALQELLAAAPTYRLDMAAAVRSNHEMVHGYTALPARPS